ncbi:hypothetical protein [Paenibacillus koleovorans]|uniref:hypothetical protein n=1 Tax=Paenibacillus koleovorans TaxID=121608 RepID=UPI000FD909B4|nr:hypothetical protein [Paenibacillus koleovorans]
MEHLLKTACSAIERLIQSSEPYNGLIPSLLDRRTGDMLQQLPPAIPGQRDSDRAPQGCNLMHDIPLLGTLYALAESEGKAEYAEAADRYIRYFATQCTDTPTGLFPWGEHAFWHLTEHRVGSSIARYEPERRAIHDHLHHAPLWLWEKLQTFNASCVQRFADGLEYHWKQTTPQEYYRHAEINRKQYAPDDVRSCDFPRHSGFYIFDLAFAYNQSRRPELLQQLEKYLDYWWELRDERGLLLIESRSPQDAVRFHMINSPTQTLSLAVSLLEAADLLEGAAPTLAATLRHRSDVYLSGFLSAPHDPAQGVFAGLCTSDNELTEEMSVWGSVYGVAIASSSALMCLAAWRLCRRPELLDWALAAGACYLEQPFPATSGIAMDAKGIRPHEHINLIGHHYVPARDAGLALELLADLYAITEERKWLDGGVHLASQFVSIYFDHEIPRGAAQGIEHYESQLGPGYLIHGMAHIALLARDGRDCRMPTEYTCR